MSESTHNLSKLTDEQIVNRWSFDFYVFKAFSAFRNEDFAAFAEFTNIIESLVVRPIDGHSDVIVKLRFMQFLSRINNGDRFDITFEDPLTPLESALNVLKHICRDMKVPQRDHEHVHDSITEMLIIVCIRGGEFERAEQMLLKHFPKGMDSAGKKKLFMNLIRKRCRSHSALQMSLYSEFKQDMLDFIERLYSIPEPFLLKMLKQPGRPNASAASPQITSSSENPITADLSRPCSRSPKPGPASAPAQVSLESLRLVYGKLSEVYGVSVPFSQLQQDVENEALLENRKQAHMELHLSETPSNGERDSEVPQERHSSVRPRYAGMTISRLVLEDDSQPSADESQDEDSTQINIVPPDRPSPRTHGLPDRPRIRSDPETDSEQQTEAPIKTHSSSLPSVNHRHSEKRRDKSDPHSDSEQQTEAQRQTPARQTRASSSPSVNHTHTEKQRDKRPRIHSDSESESEQQKEAPARQTPSKSSPSVNHTQNHRDKRPRIRSDSESDLNQQTDGQRQTPAHQTHSSSSPSVNRTHGENQSDKGARGWQDLSGTHEDWSDEESLFSAATGLSNKEKQSRKKWTVEESNWLKEGVQRFGEGQWRKIHSAFPFKERTPINLKDRWRTMKKQDLV